MAKFELRIKARQMRARGESVRDIARVLGVSRGTSSLWVRDMVLTVDQAERLKQKNIKGSELGRLRGALAQKKKRLELTKKMEEEGVGRFAVFTDNEFFATGLALYWAEGSKKTRRVQFCNSDPDLIKFLIKWLSRFFGIEVERFSARTAINEIHKNRDEIIKKYWSETTGIPISQFRKTSFKKTKLHKVYENYDNYFGVLDVNVLKPGELYYKIMGLIKGLAGVAQW